MKEVYVIGGGPSLRGFNFSRLRGHDCIVANHAIFEVPHAKHFITIDQSFMAKISNRTQQFDRHPAKKTFVVNMHNSYMKEQPVCEFPQVGKIIDTRLNLVYKLDQFDQIIKSHKCDGFSRYYKDFRCGANSGYCALQLAIVLGYTKIKLLGLDLMSHGGRTHYHNTYKGIRPGFIERFTEYFIDGLRDARKNLPDVEIISCSPISKLNQVIPYAKAF